MAEKGSMKKFMQGAAWLMMAGVIVKVLSALYRVPFQNMVGDHGFYIYQQVYPFVGIFSVWTTFGLAVAISKVLADNEPAAHPGILKTAFGFMAVLAVMWFSLLFFGAGRLAGWMGDAALSPLLKVGAFTALFLPFLAVMKGRLQAANDMQPVAFAQVGEQAVRVAVILAGTWLVLSQGASLYAAGQMAIFGAVAGGGAAVLLLMLYWRRAREPLVSPASGPLKVKGLIKQLTVISISVSLSSLVLLLFQLADSFMVFRLLAENGVPPLSAMEEKGVYDRAQPLVQFGIVIANSLVLSIVPLVALMKKKKSIRSAEAYASLAFRMSLLFGVAAAAGLTAVMPYVNEMLFQTRSGSGALIIFSWQIVWMSLLLVMTALLQGMGRMIVPALWLLLGLAVKIIGNALLIPVWGISGAAAAGNLGLLAAVFGVAVYFKKVWPVRFASRRFYSTLLAASVVMAGTVGVWEIFADGFLFDELSGRLGASLTALTAIPLGAGVFLALIAKSRVITEKQWFLIPAGRRMAAFQLKLQSNRQKRGVR